MTAKKLPFVSLGLTGYGDALNFQMSVHRACVDGLLSDGAVLCVEHPKVLTLGKNADRGFLQATQEDLNAEGIALVATDRGGEITAHMPGQMVVYPILPLSRFGLTPKKYVCLLEKSVICLLNDYGIRAMTDSKYPGVWVGDAKICAIGIRIKERVCLHGIALNVNNSLELFDKIIPCGISERRVVAMNNFMVRTVCVEEVWERYKIILAKLLSVSSYRLSPLELLGA